MSKFIDKLNRVSKTAPAPLGFGAFRAALPRPKMQLVASLAQAKIDSLADYIAGADAGLLRIPDFSSGAKSLQKMSQTVPDIPWGGWLGAGDEKGLNQLVNSGCDFVVFPAASTPLALVQDTRLGKILELEPSLTEGVVRTVNDLSVDAVLITNEHGKGHFLTWRHLMLFQRFAELLTKPLLVSIPSDVTVSELQALWRAGVEGVITEVEPPNKLDGLRKAIDKLEFPSRKQKKIEALLPYMGGEKKTADEEEEEDKPKKKVTKKGTKSA